MTACDSCGNRDAVPGGVLCRACRYYERGLAGGAMVKVTCLLPPKLLAELKQEADGLGDSLAQVIRGRIMRGGAT